MKKLLMKFVMWERAGQVFNLVGAIPAIVALCHGKVMFVDGVVIGFNLGAALYWEFYLRQRKETMIWMERAMKLPKADFEEMVGVAKNLVEARLKAADIDPDRN